MRFETAEIDRYGPLKGCRPACNDGLTIVAGPNESGKTLYLEGILQLLEPGVMDHMGSSPRVQQPPIGRIIVDDGSDRHVLGDGTALSDISRIEPPHLYNLFVIRDNDLALPDGPDYYTSLVEHLGDIHTSEIEEIRKQLAEQGQLTRKRLDLRNRQYNTKEVSNAADSLATDIEAYLESVEERGVQETIRERLQLRRELRTIETHLATQRTAKELASFEDAAEQLHEYRDATEAIQDMAAFDRETLEQLRDQKQKLSHKRKRITDLESSLEDKQADVERHRQELAEVRDRHTELQQRESNVERVESALESYRAQRDDGGGENFESQLTQRRYATIAGLVGAGIAVGGGAIAGSILAITVSVMLFLVALGAWISHRRLTNRAIKAESQKQELLQKARDAGFDVEMPEEVAPLLRGYLDELGGVESRIHELDVKLEQATERVEELKGNLNRAISDRQRFQEELTSTLEAADVESIDGYETRVDEKEKKQRHRSEAKMVLDRDIGVPDVATPVERITFWESKLEDWKSNIGATDVDAEQYDEEGLGRLKERQTELGAGIDELEDELKEYHDALDTFERRATNLTPPPFVETDPCLEACTTEGLRDLLDDLYALVETIERNADISRKAIEILDAIKEDEEQKVATLFAPEGPASQVLSHLTSGRYTAVDYDTDTEALEVTTSNDQIFTPHQLSRGTRDQLYFAARLSLARQLLGGDTGFLLLEDPFLAADRSRLSNGFETLRRLTDDGWQIVYLTAKQEVYQTMADEFDCELYQLDLLEY